MQIKVRCTLHSSDGQKTVEKWALPHSIVGECKLVQLIYIANFQYLIKSQQ